MFSLANKSTNASNLFAPIAPAPKSLSSSSTTASLKPYPSNSKSFSASTNYLKPMNIV